MPHYLRFPTVPTSSNISDKTVGLRYLRHPVSPHINWHKTAEMQRFGQNKAYHRYLFAELHILRETTGYSTVVVVIRSFANSTMF